MRAIAFLVLLLFGSGCDSTDPESGLGNLVLILNPAGVAGNSVLIQTEQEFAVDCGIDVRIDGDGQSIEIEILGAAVSGGACADVPGPYGVLVPLPTFGIDGYRVELSKDGLTDV